MALPNFSSYDSSPKRLKAADVILLSGRQVDDSYLTIEQDEKSDQNASHLLMTVKANFESSRLSPWLASIAYPLGRYGLLPFYFRRIEVSGQEHLPAQEPVILAPTHRSRWDAFILPYAAGQDITGRPLRFMVTADEVKGIQGWFVRRLGGFSINTNHPAIASLRYSIELLQNGEVLVIFPEGGDLRGNRSCKLNRLQPGLARLALKAEASQAGLGIQIVPIDISYSCPSVRWRSRVRVCIGAPLKVADYVSQPSKLAAKHLTADLERTLQDLNDCGVAERD